MSEQIIGNTYEDKRTHRSGKVVSYNTRFKTYLLEASDGKSFNVSASQFKINWRQIEEAEVQEEVKPVVEPAKVKSGTTYKGPTEEQKKELNDLYTNAVLLAQSYINSFENNAVAIKIKPAKNTFRIRVDRPIVFDIQVMTKFNKFRAWLFEDDFNKFITSCTLKPLTTKKYPYAGNTFTAEYDLCNLQQVLEDLRPIVLDYLVAIRGGL